MIIIFINNLNCYEKDKNNPPKLFIEVYKLKYTHKYKALNNNY